MGKKRDAQIIKKARRITGSIEKQGCKVCGVYYSVMLLKEGRCGDCRKRASQAFEEQKALEAEEDYEDKVDNVFTNPERIKTRTKDEQATPKGKRHATQDAGPAPSSSGGEPPKIGDPEEEAAFDAKRSAERELAERELCRRRYLPFVMRFSNDYLPGWVHKDIAKRLEKFSDAVANKESPRLMLFMPPRHGKSQLTSKMFAAWHLGRHPTHEFINCSYSGSLSMQFSRQVRQIMREDGYAKVFPKTRLDPDSQSVENWLTTDGGGYVAAGVGGAITGKGAHVLGIDDPVKNRDDAESETSRQSVWDWYTSTAYTRLSPGGGVLVILTRWHDDDLAGRLIAEMDAGGDKWEIVSYPAIADVDEPYRKKGEALHPERYGLSALKRIQRAIGPRDWAALYQQTPVAVDGDFIVKDMIKYYGPAQLPPLEDMVFYDAWDLAIGLKQQNDWTVGITVGIDRDDNIWLVELTRGHWTGLEIVERILDQQKRWNSAIVGVERGQISMALGPILKKRIAERNQYTFRLEELRPGRTDKVLRARTIQARMQQGKVRIPSDAPWTTTLVNELLRFPNGVFDDQMDTLAWVGLMINMFTPRMQPRIKKNKSWRDRLKSRTGSRNAMTS
jgi:predicted phage terminase large subunit-like protein